MWVIKLDSRVWIEVVNFAEVRKVAPDAFKLLLSDVAIPIRVKVFKYRLKNKTVAQNVLVHCKRNHE